MTTEEKYQVWLEVTAGQGTQRAIAERWNIDRATVLKIIDVAKAGAFESLERSRPGRRGKSSEERELEAARAEVARLTETVKEQACELMLLRGKGRWD